MNLAIEPLALQREECLERCATSRFLPWGVAARSDPSQPMLHNLQDLKAQHTSLRTSWPFKSDSFWIVLHTAKFCLKNSPQTSAHTPLLHFFPGHLNMQNTCSDVGAGWFFRLIEKNPDARPAWISCCPGSNPAVGRRPKVRHSLVRSQSTVVPGPSSVSVCLRSPIWRDRARARFKLGKFVAQPHQVNLRKVGQPE
jgi:hypothetical protein